jgi:hypothetical protein
LFFRLQMLKAFLTHSTGLKNQLLQELITNATDPVICMRRFRMLQQISTYEGLAIKKIQNLQTEDVLDFLKPSFIKEANSVVNRDA